MHNATELNIPFSVSSGGRLWPCVLGVRERSSWRCHNLQFDALFPCELEEEASQSKSLYLSSAVSVFFLNHQWNPASPPLPLSSLGPGPLHRGTPDCNKVVRVESYLLQQVSPLKRMELFVQSGTTRPEQEYQNCFCWEKKGNININKTTLLIKWTPVS